MFLGVGFLVGMYATTQIERHIERKIKSKARPNDREEKDYHPR